MRIIGTKSKLHITQSYNGRKTTSFWQPRSFLTIGCTGCSFGCPHDVDYFPAFLKIDGKPVLLVGGGEVALRKARLLLDTGARLSIVTPETIAAVDELVQTHDVRLLRRSFQSADVDGHWLVVSATGVPEIERRVARACDAAGIFCNAVDDIDNCSFITPATIDRSPVVVAISSGGRAPVLARKVKSMIEAMLPSGVGSLAALAGRWRARVSTRLESFVSRLRFWERVFDGHVADEVYAGRLQSANALMESLLDEADAVPEDRQPGFAWLTGAGPGDPDLVTLKALQAMQFADVILHDRLVSRQVLALARRDAERISVGKIPGCTLNSQDQTTALLVRLVADGKRVCRLKGGDPFIFGRGGEEAEALAAAGLPYAVIPGITAAAGCAASAGIPLTHRDSAQSLVLLTGHGKDSVDALDWPSLARDRQTLAVYMGVRRFPELMQNLTANGRSADTPVAIIERGTTQDERVIRGTLGQLPMLADAHGVVSPAMLIIGDVARQGIAGASAAPPAARLPSISPPESAIQRA